MMDQIQTKIVVPLIHKVIKVIAIVVAVVVVAAAILHIVSHFAKASNPNQAIANRIHKDSKAQWNNIKSPNEKINTNYGGGYLQILDQNGKSLTPPAYSEPYKGFNALAGAVDAKKNPLPHTEQLVVEWAQRQIGKYVAANPGVAITTVKLLIYTYRKPCGACGGNLSGKWRELLETESGGATVEIDVWTSKGNPGAKNTSPWP